MSNRSFLGSRHPLLPGYSPLNSPSSLAPPHEFSYDAAPRSERRTVRDNSSYSRSSQSNTSSTLSMAFPNEFPYGISGVQMPTLNYGSELFNYVSNGFPRKSRMCSFCNKVFTRSTTRRYHERRCPLLKASKSLVNFDSSGSDAVSVAVENLREHQQRQNEEGNASSNALTSTTRTSNSSVTTSSSSNGRDLPAAPTSTSTSPQALHPAYPTAFPPLGSSPSRVAAAAYSYAQYGNHFYNTISAAAMASLDQNSNTLQQKKEYDSMNWSSSPSPSSKNLGLAALTKTYGPDSGMDLTAKYCPEYSFRSQPPVFPQNSLRGIPAASESPEPGERKPDRVSTERNSATSQAYSEPSGKENEWSSNVKQEYPDKISVANISGARLKTTPTSPPVQWGNKAHLEKPQEKLDVVHTIDDDDDDDDDEVEYEDEDNEDEVGEDETQFNESQNGDDKAKDDENTNSLECQYCHKIFTDIITRKAHEVLHLQMKSIACAICSSAFHCEYGLRIHIQCQHNEGPYKCKLCSMEFDEITALIKHLSDHTLPGKELCSLKYFSSPDHTSDHSPSQPHRKFQSDGEQDSKENKSIVLGSNVDALSDTEAGSKKINPDNSEQQVSNGDVNEETQECQICTKDLKKFFKDLNNKKKTKAEKIYQCPICKKMYGYKNNMRSHLKDHAGIKRFMCPICKAKFNRGSTLKRHGQTHNFSLKAIRKYGINDEIVRVMSSNGSRSNASTTPNTTLITAVHTTSPEYTSHSRKTPTDPNINPHPSARHSFPSPSITELERYGNATRGTPPKSSPQNLVSARMSQLNSNALTSPMAGGLAAVAAANLFAYPAAAAPHLYQLYASTNQLMNYSAYASSLAPAVQSDALNLSVGKRKKEEEDTRFKDKFQQRRYNESNGISPVKKSWIKESIKIEVEEPGEMSKKDGHNPFIACIASKKENAPPTTNGNHYVKNIMTQDELKITTEDFGAQVNICCPSPLVQSSTGSLQHHSSSGSPVGSLCNGNNIHSHASPSGISTHSSPANSSNSAPSPTNTTEHQLHELLLSLLASGRMFSCSFCEIYFTEYAMFRLHQKYHQSDIDRPFLCSVCGEDCKDKTYFTVHLSEHLGLNAKGSLA